MNVVLDTNVLVSAIWSPGRSAYEIVQAVIGRRFTACYDHRILEEYQRVMRYPKFGFSDWEVSAVLEPIIKNGFSIAATPLPDIPFTDESDRKFYEVAREAHAVLVTGNGKHYPDDGVAMRTADFYERYVLGG